MKIREIRIVFVLLIGMWCFQALAQSGGEWPNGAARTAMGFLKRLDYLASGQRTVLPRLESDGGWNRLFVALYRQRSHLYDGRVRP